MWHSQLIETKRSGLEEIIFQRALDSLNRFQLPGITLGCPLCSALFPVHVSPPYPATRAGLRSLIKLATTKDRQAVNKTCSCIIHILLNCIVCAAVQPNCPQSLFLSIEEIEMGFLCVRADEKSKNHICSSERPSSLLNVSWWGQNY